MTKKNNILEYSIYYTQHTRCNKKVGHQTTKNRVIHKITNSIREKQYVEEKEEEDSEPNVTGPETPLKVVESIKKVEDNILQIDLKKSSEKNGQMATEFENIMNHFNIDMADVEGLINPNRFSWQMRSD